MPPGNPAAPTGLSFRWWHGFAAGLCALAAPPFAVLAAIMALPIGAAYLLRRQLGQEVPRIVAAYVAVAFIHPALSLWRAGAQWDTMWAVLMEPWTLAADWGAAMAGWMIFDLIKICTRLSERQRHDGSIRTVNAARASLEQEWGIGGTGADPPASSGSG